MQQKTKKDLQSEILDLKSKIRELHGSIDYLISENKKISDSRHDGSIIVDIEDMLNDVHFMYRIGETRVRLIYRNGQYKSMEGVDDHIDILPLTKA